MTVFFRLTYSVRDLRIPANVVHSFHYGGPHDILVRLQSPSPEEQSLGYKTENAFCRSFQRIEPRARNESVFADIVANRVLPSDAEERNVAASYTGPGGVRIRIPALTDFPEHFRTFIDGVRSTLSDHARRTIAVLRWRANQAGPHSPMAHVGWHWSTDQQFWHRVPSNTSAVGDFVAAGRLTPRVIEQVREMVVAGETEPIGHEMLREADDQKWSSPRSAIVIGLAAAELATKRCVALLVPDTEWLVMHLPMPPLVQLLTDYVPTLPARHRFGDAVKPPPPDVVSAIKKGVTIRNQLVHAGTTKPNSEDAIELLRAVRDLLWLLDYYSGNDWALEYLRHDTRAALAV